MREESSEEGGGGLDRKSEGGIPVMWDAELRGGQKKGDERASAELSLQQGKVRRYLARIAEAFDEGKCAPPISAMNSLFRLSG